MDSQIIISREDNTDFLSLGYIQTDTSLVSALGGALASFAEEIGLGGDKSSTHEKKSSSINLSRFPNGVIASKIAAHAGDVARGLEGAGDRDKKISVARTNLDWKTHLAESLDPQTAETIHRKGSEEAQGHDQQLQTADYCSMCGKQWCSVRTNKEICEVIKSKK